MATHLELSSRRARQSVLARRWSGDAAAHRIRVLVRDASRLAELLDRSVTGELAVRVAGTAPLADAATVYAKVGSGGQRGRWLLVP